MRKYALTKVAEGDWLCLSDDASTLYRFSTYEDGTAHGLIGVAYERRLFWRVRSVAMDRLRGVSLRGHLPPVEELPWLDGDLGFPTRRAAVASVFGAEA